MRLLSIVIFIFAAATCSAQSKAWQIYDPAALGEYTLIKKNSKSDVQKAELIYNNDNQLVVRTDRFDQEYELSSGDKDGVVYTGEDEPNCDGGEDVCEYDLQTTIKLLSTTVDGKEMPQLSIEITIANAWDEDGKDNYTNTYILNWSKTLPYAIPFYLNALVPEEAQALNQSCMENLKDIEYDFETTSYHSATDICPNPDYFTYRNDLDEAFPYLKNGWLGKKHASQVQEVSKEDVKKLVFDAAKNLAQQYQAKKASLTSATIISEIEKIESYALNAGDRYFIYPNYRSMGMFIANTKNKTIVRLMIQVSKNNME
ncbi:MAG: hypothetical protein H6623_08275 [Bdellovibrionaceae bacterium]|nr:hypothetical protein [Pseudobdellovibrionaceae bacterium]